MTYSTQAALDALSVADANYDAAYDKEWNAGYQSQVEGIYPWDMSNHSEAWQDGFWAAHENALEDLAAAERDCCADYDAQVQA